MLLLSPLHQILFLLFLLLCFCCPSSSWTVPHGHFTPSGLCDGWAWYCVFCWLLHDLPCSRFQAPLKSTCFIISAASSPFTPLTNFTAFHTLHELFQGSKSRRATSETAASVGVEASFAFGAKVSAEAGVAVFYSASWTSVHIWRSESIVPWWAGMQAFTVLSHSLSS